MGIPSTGVPAKTWKSDLVIVRYDIHAGDKPGVYLQVRDAEPNGVNAFGQPAYIYGDNFGCLNIEDVSALAAFLSITVEEDTSLFEAIATAAYAYLADHKANIHWTE